MHKVTSTIVVVLSVILIAWLMSSFGIVAGVLFIPLIGSIYALGNPRYIVLVYFAFVSIAGLISANVRLPLIDYVDELLMLIMIASITLHFLLHRFKASRMEVISVHFIGLVFVVLLSWFVNRSSIIQLIHFMMTYLSFIPMFYLGVHLRHRYDSSDPLRWLACLLPVNLILNAAWLVGINPLANPQWLFYDKCIGTFYNSHTLGYCMMFMIVVATSGWLYERDRSRRFRYSVLIGLSLLQYLATFVMHSIPLLVFLMLIGMLWFWKDRWGKILRITAFMTVAILVMSLSVVAFEHRILNAVRDDLTWRRIKPYLTRVQDSPKGIVYKHVFMTAPKNYSQRLFGFGPGNFASLVGVQYGSANTQYYISYLYDSYEGRRLWKGTSFVENPQTGVTGVFSEIGLLGGGLYFIVHFAAIVHFVLMIKRDWLRNPSDLAMAQGWVLIMVGYLMLNFVWDLFGINLFRSGLWFWAGLLWNRNEREAQGDNEEGSRPPLVNPFRQSPKSNKYSEAGVA